MTAHRVSIPVTPGLGWIVRIPELCLGATRPASPAALHELEAAFATFECAGCAGAVQRALRALSLALDGAVADDELRDPPHGDATD